MIDIFWSQGHCQLLDIVSFIVSICGGGIGESEVSFYWQLPLKWMMISHHDGLLSYCYSSDDKRMYWHISLKFLYAKLWYILCCRKQFPQYYFSSLEALLIVLCSCLSNNMWLEITNIVSVDTEIQTTIIELCMTCNRHWNEWWFHITMVY